MFHKLYPDKPTMATECCSCMSQRGIDKDMCKDPQDGGCGGIPSPTGVFYNNNIGECTAQQVQISDHPEYIAGTFVWSGFDYLGEARGWPQNTKCRGTISDVAGFTKETAYWLRSWWLSNISTSDPGRPLLLHHEKTSRKNGIDNKMIYNDNDDHHHHGHYLLLIHGRHHLKNTKCFKKYHCIRMRDCKNVFK